MAFQKIHGLHFRGTLSCGMGKNDWVRSFSFITFEKDSQRNHNGNDSRTTFWKMGHRLCRGNRGRVCQVSSAERREALLLLITVRCCMWSSPNRNLGRWRGFLSSCCQDFKVHGNARSLLLGQGSGPLCMPQFLLTA